MISIWHRLFRRYLRISRRVRISRKRLSLLSMGQVELASSSIVEGNAQIVIHTDASAKWIVRIGKGTIVKDYAYLGSRGGFIDIGKDSSVNPFCVILGYGGVTIGNNVRIATHTSIIAFNHNFSDLEKPIVEQGSNWRGIVIEDDVWIGSGCRILDGVIIGRGSVIGAGSVVNRSIAPFSVAVGVPARVVKTRKA